MQTLVLLATAYFPPIQYFSKLTKGFLSTVELHENYSKQSYRNRCHILGSNGLLPLSVPVVKGNSKSPIKQVRIDYSELWQRQHLRALDAAYKSSPFYEFYIDDLLHLFQPNYTFLYELNQSILSTCCELLELESGISYSNHYEHSPNGLDFRQIIHPKKSYQKEDSSFCPIPYTQVFAQKEDYFPNLSILDLLFNLGPNSLDYLEDCVI